MKSRTARSLVLTCAVLALSFGCGGQDSSPSRVRVVPVPQHGRLPDARLDAEGRLHLVYLAGNNLYYTTSADSGASFETPVRVNERAEFAAGALFRGPKLAVMADGSAHIVWYNRGYALGLDRSQWGVMYSSVRRGMPIAPALYVLRGGADGYSVTTDGTSVLVGWHDENAVSVSRRAPGESEFERPVALQSVPCECCDTALALRSGRVAWAVYRDREDNRRDVFLHEIDLQTGSQRRQRLDTESWIIEGCPISGVGFAVEGEQALVAWEHDGSILAARAQLPQLTATRPLRMGEGKYPLALIGASTFLIGWKDGSRLRWSVLDRQTLNVIEQGSVRSASTDRPSGVATGEGRFVLFP